MHVAGDPAAGAGWAASATSTVHAADRDQGMGVKGYRAAAPGVNREIRCHHELCGMCQIVGTRRWSSHPSSLPEVPKGA